MPTTHDIGPVTQIPEGGGRMLKAGKRIIAVFRTADGAIYASQPECPHRMGPLANGTIEGTTLTCPIHQWAFDLRTGEVQDGDCGITVYPIVVDGNGTMVVTMP